MLSLKVTQAGVDDKFRMILPVYVELADGNIAFLGRARLIGNSSVGNKAPLKGLKTKPGRAMVNDDDDVLASPNQSISPDCV